MLTLICLRRNDGIPLLTGKERGGVPHFLEAIMYNPNKDRAKFCNSIHCVMVCHEKCMC